MAINFVAAWSILGLLINLNRIWKRVREALVNRKKIYTGRLHKLKIYARITKLRRKIVKYETICVLSNIHSILQFLNVLFYIYMPTVVSQSLSKFMRWMINLTPKLGAAEWCNLNKNS